MADDFEDLYDLDSLDDTSVYDLILQELHEYPDLDPDLVDIQVENGFVTLSGRVGTEQELQVIEHILTDVLGIANYSNELVIDELARAEAPEGADDAVIEDEEVEAQLGEEGDRTETTADHLFEDLPGELWGTHDLQKAIEQGEAYEPPDRPIQEGSWSEERH